MSIDKTFVLNMTEVPFKVPFIDDHISCEEEISDYVSKYSGIFPGDLDPTRSSHHLTSLKRTYKKVRHLVDAGCIFVGHGLKNDFDMLGIVVPSDQVVDTVHLFHLPHWRLLSLKFLAWYFLDKRIPKRVPLLQRRCGDMPQITFNQCLSPSQTSVCNLNKATKLNIPQIDPQSIIEPEPDVKCNLNKAMNFNLNLNTDSKNTLSRCSSLSLHQSPHNM
ncbi:hypothetical protein TCAL_14515 [Tigriopus californicus]|uniref:Exonuclease domain-containing protein n=1 Tax=Tigriopus californicus TaxID=6832 RepID=A0A553PT38_TIGCA|nr:hypothetical protein TCAL_14515 [Tigriopus californicus]